MYFFLPVLVYTAIAGSYGKSSFLKVGLIEEHLDETNLSETLMPGGESRSRRCTGKLCSTNSEAVQSFFSPAVKISPTRFRSIEDFRSSRTSSSTKDGISSSTTNRKSSSTKDRISSFTKDRKLSSAKDDKSGKSLTNPQGINEEEENRSFVTVHNKFIASRQPRIPLLNGCYTHTVNILDQCWIVCDKTILAACSTKIRF
ncbi:uncharacterized protein LOC111714622 [Eurytemora carolleeae]|uniref:uncharacterized protein LOC111714622 n=1 Tax=Eurytemora carolleeae TaxID=1294199 RepID=UPI000C77C9A5|nr:uncharacterized protein LOC111714622 [Eurytemora carolleeae]|eukprot:XP_023345537.1 uncharacterized protein LOC111714622 [Eurytemora affinis]